jgi:MFS transporter, OFA family, oxalate/formate antiporter
LTAGSRATGRRGIFFGWYIVSAAFISFFLAFGFIYSFGIFALPIADVIHYDVEAVSSLFSFSYCVFLITGLGAGLLADRIGGHWLVAAGGILFGFGLIGAGRATTNLQISAAFAFGVGLGMACIYVPATGVVEAWFVRERGYATGITVGGFEAGNLVIPIVATVAILQWGVRATLTGFGAIMLVVIPALAFVMASRPEDRGLYPDGAAEPPTEANADKAGKTLGEAVRLRTFWQMYLAVFFASFAIFLPFAHLNFSAVERGVPAPIAAGLVALIGLGGLAGRFGLGRYTDRVSPKRLLALTFGVLALSMLVWGNSTRVLGFSVFAALFGLAYATSSALEPALAIDYFGTKHGGAILGLLFTAGAPGSLLGPTLTGELYDRTGSYHYSILIGMIVFVIATVLVVLLPDPATTVPAPEAGKQAAPV